MIDRWIPVATMAIALCGCNKKKAYEHDCVAVIQSLGTGDDDLSLPRDEAARDKSLAAIGKSLDTWGPAQASLTLDDVRKVGSALASDLEKRKALLAAATFAADVPVPTGSERKDALAKSAAAAFGKHIDKASLEALPANAKQYRADFAAMMAICAGKF
jgi:hypothetical protein